MYKLKDLFDKSSSKISGNLFIQACEKYKVEIDSINKYLYKSDSDADRPVPCLNTYDEFKLPHWKFVLRFCGKCPEFYIPKEETSYLNS